MLKSVLALSILVSATASYAALPPLSKSKQESYASHLIEGQVLSIEDKLVFSRGDDPDFQNRIYKARVKVTKFVRVQEYVEQTEDEITVHYWRMAKRPRGWGGPTGQNQLLEVGQTSRFYLTKSASGTSDYHLIDPNGWGDVEEVVEYTAEEEVAPEPEQDL